MRTVKMCQQCQKTFVPPITSPKQKFCCRQCYFDSKQTYIPCAVCGKPLKGTQMTQHRKFCSRECYDSHRESKYVFKDCPVCNKPFKVLIKQLDRYNVCSWKCRTINYKERICPRCGKIFLLNINRKYCSEECYRPPHYRDCVNCKKTFRIIPSDTDRRFCSFSCYRKHNGETLPEKQVRLLLDALNISFIQEAKMGRYSVDFLLINLNIALEVDGEYWHRNKEKDDRKDAYMLSKGFSVVRITDTELENRDNGIMLLQERINFQSQVQSSNGTRYEMAEILIQGGLFLS